MKSGESAYDYLFEAVPEPEIDAGTTALLVVDMQYLDASRDHGWGRVLRDKGVERLATDFFDRLEQETIPNIRALQAACRRDGIEVIFVRIEAQRRDLKDASRPYRVLGFNCLHGSKEAEILHDLAPLNGEVVISKTSTGAFNSSTLDQVLRNLGIAVLLVVGVNTDACVELTSRDAADRGYCVIVVSDGCACLHGHAEHEQALARMGQGVISIKTTAEVLVEIQRGVHVVRTSSAIASV
jgi:ureidoacrylate peracid hydrolase